jgi:glycosyltransferase involved in cell wall biosynthesis
MKKMIVIFENLEPVHLGKDVGALPEALQTNENWDVSLYSTFGYFTQSDYEKNVRLKFFTSFKNRKINKLLLFMDILKDAKKIDYLMVFHGGKDKSILFWLCKILNKNLTTYVKLDMGELNASTIIHKSLTGSFFKKMVRSLLSKSVDVFTVETKQVFEMIKELPQYKNKLHYLPNGFYADTPYDWVVPKEKMIISVGRIGTPQKNNELLLSAIEQLTDIGEYVFYFIGPVEQSFRKSVDSLLARRGDLTDKIVLTGNISNKQELYGYYKRAEILCFTSIYEGFSLVMAEALYFGCYLVSTDLAAAYDLSDNGNYGQIVNVNQALINDCKEQGITDIVQYCDNNFEAILLTEWFSQSSKKLCFTLQNIIDGKVDTNTAAHYLACNTYENFNWVNIAKSLVNIFEICRVR